MSLARAVYADSDIYLLDDPLSAVDSHVGRHLFDQVIGHHGILKNKTRILVTHKLTVLPHVDQILVIKDGVISESGSYAELVAQKGDFAEFLVQFLTEENEEVVDENELQAMEEMAAAVKPEIERRMSRIRSETSSERGSKTGSELRRRKPSGVGSGIGSDRKKSIAQSAKGQGQEDRRKAARKGAKLVEAETAEVGSVKWSIYLKYFRAIGISLFFGIMFLNMCSSALNVGSSFW